MIKRVLVCSLVAILAVIPLAAQTDPNSGMDTVSEDDFFGTDAVEAPASETASSTYQESFLKEEPVRIGGSFKLSMKTGIDYYRDWADWSPDYVFLNAIGTRSLENPVDKAENSAIDLGGSLYFIARPSDALKFYGKSKFSLPFSSDAATLDPPAVDPGIKVPNIKIWELYTDLDIDNVVFIRAGKQMVKWSAGSFYQFFSPADIISLTPIDVNDREAEREGPIAVKANIPFGNNNVDLYMIAPSDGALSSVSDFGLAGRVQVVLGGWELGLGAGYQKDRDIQFVSTASGSIWKFGVFAEALVNRKSPGSFVSADGILTENREDWFFSGTVGGNYSNTDIYFDTLFQYYFNGMGYVDSSGAVSYLKSGSASYADVFSIASGYTGMHNIAVTVSESFVKDSTVTVSATALANLSDVSGFVSPAVTVKVTDEISLSVNSSVYFGSDNTQFRGMRQALSESGNPTIMALADYFQMPRFKMGINVNIGSGNF